jgi:hypothetical protein
LNLDAVDPTFTKSIVLVVRTSVVMVLLPTSGAVRQNIYV